MGERGQITRLLAAKYGGHLTFAALSADRASAPGQPTIEQLRGLYRFRTQGRGSRLFGIIGNPVHHSKSPLIHNSAFEHIGGFGGCARAPQGSDMSQYPGRGAEVGLTCHGRWLFLTPPGAGPTPNPRPHPHPA